MPITITIHESGQYYISKYEGKITDGELIPAYDAFYAKNNVGVGLPELADVSLADSSQVSRMALLKLAYWKKTLHQRRGELIKKTAIYISERYDGKNATIYEVWTKGSPELVRIFSNQDQAVLWLLEKNKPQQMDAGDT